MLYKKILLSVDGSDHARAAALKTRQIIEETGGEVDIINVVVPVTGLDHYERLFPMIPLVTEAYDEIGKNILEDTKEVFGDDIPVNTVLLYGDPATEIIAQSKKGYDLLVLGAHGSSGRGFFSMGSVVSKVIHHTDTSVLVVR